MPHRRRTSSIRSISRGRSGRKLGGVTIKSSPSRSTVQPRRVSERSIKSGSMSAPQMARTRARRSLMLSMVLGAGNTST